MLIKKQGLITSFKLIYISHKLPTEYWKSNILLYISFSW